MAGNRNYRTDVAAATGAQRAQRVRAGNPMRQALTDLQRITANCDVDMSDGDVTATVTGTLLENDGGPDELRVRFKTAGGYYQTINLAALVALARKATL